MNNAITKEMGDPEYIPQFSGALRVNLKTLLEALPVLQPLVYCTDKPEWADHRLGKTHAGGAPDAAQVTMCNVLDRIDWLVQNDKNWAVGQADEDLAKAVADRHRESTEVLRTRKELIRQSNRPCVIFGAKLFTMSDGTFRASLDEVLREDSVSVQGGTIAETLANFDAAFTP